MIVWLVGIRINMVDKISELNKKLKEIELTKVNKRIIVLKNVYII